MHNEYQLSQILVANEDEARAIREQLAGGADFAEMAKKYSLGPEAGDGGSWSTSTIGNMYYWIEEAPGEHEGRGYHAAPADGDGMGDSQGAHASGRSRPKRTCQYARKKVEADKQKKMIAEMKQKIEKDIGLVIYPEAVNIVYNNLPPDIPMEDIVTYKVTRDNAPKLEIPEQYQGMLLAQYADGSYTLKDYMKIFDEIGLPERPSHKYGKESDRRIDTQAHLGRRSPDLRRKAAQGSGHARSREGAPGEERNDADVEVLRGPGEERGQP